MEYTQYDTLPICQFDEPLRIADLQGKWLFNHHMFPGFHGTRSHIRVEMIGGIDDHQFNGWITQNCIVVPDQFGPGVFSLRIMSVSLQDLADFISGMCFKQRTVKDQSRHSVGAECSVDWFHAKYFVY